MNASVFLNAELNERFHRDGWVVVDFLAQPPLEAMRRAWSGARQLKSPGFDSAILSNELEYRQAVDQTVRAALSPPVSALAPCYRVAFCTFVTKSPCCQESEVPLHQDWSFVDERVHMSVGVWCPLEDVNTNNGCLQVVTGSHALPYPPRAACTPFAYPELEPYLRTECLEAVPMQAGQAMFFDQRLFHCSPPNRGSSARVAMTAVLVPAGCIMRYFHVLDMREPDLVEVFEVEDQFYVTHSAGIRPAGAKSLGIIRISEWERAFQ